MKELLFIVLFSGVFLLVSAGLRLLLIKLRPIWGLLIIPYLISVYFYVDLMLQAHYFLRDRQIYLEFGHGELELLMVGIAMMIVALIIAFDVVGRKLSPKG